MLGWLLKYLKNASPKSPWIVRVLDDVIVTSDGQGTERKLPVAELMSVVVVTDDSGPWGDDVIYLLYSDRAEPVGIFPLEADGGQDFVDWLSDQPGYDDRELAKAMSSTDVAQFVVFTA